MFNSLVPGCVSGSPKQVILVRLRPRDVIRCDNVAFGRVNQSKLLSTSDHPYPILLISLPVFNPSAVLRPSAQGLWADLTVTYVIILSPIQQIHSWPIVRSINQLGMNTLNVKAFAYMAVRNQTHILILIASPSV